MGAQDPSGVDDNIAGVRATDDARPIHRVYVDGFFMDETDVTNRQFAEFVRGTGYLTVAERAPRATRRSDNGMPCSLVFTPQRHPASVNNDLPWWSYVNDANWRQPTGPGSSIAGKDNYPVVQIAYQDAMAYVTWAHKRLPTEAEWEFAARGGLAGKIYAWGDDFRPRHRWMANTYQGRFPTTDFASDGFAGVAPVGSFPPNRYGLYDMSGNVWEWTSDWYRPDYYSALARAGGVARNPKGPAEAWDPAEPSAKKKVHRGGSFLCSEQYCPRYMVGTRGKGEINTATNHLGFRCVSGSPAVVKHQDR